MPKHDSVDRDRRAVLAGGGALILGATLWPANLRAQSNSGNKMPIGTIGAGHIGGTIGGLWVKDGHKVFFSSRHPEALKDLVTNLGPLAAGRHRRPGNRIRRCRVDLCALWCATADRPGSRSRVQG